MVLVGIQVYCMNSPWVCRDQIVQQVVTCRSKTQDNVLGIDFEKSLIDSRVLPSEAIDEAILKLGVLLKVLFVVNSPLMVLVKGGRQGKICGEIHNS